MPEFALNNICDPDIWSEDNLSNVIIQAQKELTSRKFQAEQDKLKNFIGKHYKRMFADYETEFIYVPEQDLVAEELILDCVSFCKEKFGQTLVEKTHISIYDLDSLIGIAREEFLAEKQNFIKYVEEVLNDEKRIN